MTDADAAAGATAPRPDFAERYGPWAVVAGAGAGMGAAYTRHLAALGLRVLAVDRDPDALAALADEVGTGGPEVEPLVADLAEPDAHRRILAACSDRDTGLLVANAALSYVGPFKEQSLASITGQLDVNLRATVTLVHGLLPHLLDRGRGGIVLMSSLSARRGAPLVATYAATKAYLAELAESLWEELGHDGIDVLGVLPGSTRTPGWLASQPQAGMGTATLMDGDEVVAEALAALGAGQPLVVPGSANRDSDAFMAGLDRAEAIRLTGEVMRAMYPPDRAPDPTV